MFAKACQKAKAHLKDAAEPSSNPVIGNSVAEGDCQLHTSTPSQTQDLVNTGLPSDADVTRNNADIPCTFHGVRKLERLVGSSPEHHFSDDYVDSEATCSDTDDGRALPADTNVLDTQQDSTPAANTSQSDDPQLVLECPPKDFSRAETEQKSGRYRTRTTKGTIHFMSPCGAKIFCGEMVKSESMAILLHYLSSFFPLIAEDLEKTRKKKMTDELGNETQFKIPNGKEGM